ncbi:MAG: DUF456 domain-containing protein [Armatimonadetes bacterium]|nr:DUF456 domain-containing protein [Armatimonadota bacterium]MDW8027642.1 DUF456 domain-containing protein [Armatimonadota bacterium]
MEWSVLLKVFVTFLPFIGALAVVVGLPGTFIAWLGLALYAVSTRFAHVSGWALLGTFFGCAFFELADNLISGLMVKKFGASKGSMVMAWVGGILGAVLSGFLGGMLGFIGSAFLGFIGAFLGSYTSVYWWERYRLNRTSSEAKKAAFGTVVGRLMGIALKLAWIIWLISLIWRL